MKILLDTAVLLEDLGLRSATLEVLLSARRKLALEVLVSAVSVDEAAQHRARDIRGTYTSICDSLRGLERMTGGSALTLGVSPSEIALASDSVRSRLQARLAELEIGILPYPKVPHDEIVARIGDRRTPFRKDERGYRDFLIWRSLLETISSPGALTVVTPNWRDFASGNSLAKDLVADLPNGCAASWFPSVSAFNDAEVLPRLSRVTALEETLKSDKSLQEALLEAAWAHLDRPTLRRSLHTPVGTDLEEIQNFELVPPPEIESVTQLATGDYAVAFDTELQAEVAVGGEYDAIDRIERHHFGRSLPFDLDDWHYRSTEVTVGATVSVQAVLAADLSVSSVSVLGLGWDDLY